MFKKIRPICFFAYGWEARFILRNEAQRLAKLSPELRGLFSAILFTEISSKNHSEYNIPEEINDEFFKGEADRFFPIHICNSDTLGNLESQVASIRLHLTTYENKTPAIEKGWSIPAECEPILVTLLDATRNPGPDWPRIFKIVKSEWYPDYSTGLSDSFNVLLGPRLQEDFNDFPSDSEPFANSSRAFIHLHAGNPHPESDEDWRPQTVALDGRLENGDALVPGDELRTNIVDIINGLVALTLTDNSTFSDKNSVRTAGAIRIGIPKLELLQEHQNEWLGKFFQESPGNNGEEIRPILCREKARAWIRNTKLHKAESILSAGLIGNVKFDLQPCQTNEIINHCLEGLDYFWIDRTEKIPAKLEAELTKFLKDQDDAFTKQISNWLDEDLTLDEITKIIEMIRGIDNTGLTSHGEFLDDLRSLKLKEIERLSDFLPPVDASRIPRYLAFRSALDELFDTYASVTVENPESPIDREDPQEDPTEPPPAEQFQERLSQFLPDGITIEEVTAAIDRVTATKVTADPMPATSIEGWEGNAFSRTLPTGKTITIPDMADEKVMRDLLNLCRLELEDAKIDLKNEPPIPVADGEVERRNSLLDQIHDKTKEVEELESQCSIARKCQEEWQINVQSAEEQHARVQLIRESIEDQLLISKCCIRQDEVKIQELKNKKSDVKLEFLHQKENEKSKFVNYSGSGALLAILICIILFFLSGKASVSNTSFSASITPTNNTLNFLVAGKHSVPVTIPVGNWNNRQLVALFQGDSVSNKNIDPKQIEKFEKYLTVAIQDGFVKWSPIESSKLQVKPASGNDVVGLASGEYDRTHPYGKYGLVFLAGLAAVAVLWLGYQRRSRLDQSRLKSLDNRIETKETKLKSFIYKCRELINKGADCRIELNALDNAVQAIDSFAKGVEKVNTSFQSYRNSLDNLFQSVNEQCSDSKELSKSRAFYSVFSREQLNHDILTQDIRDRDHKKFLDFKAQWERSRIWIEFEKRMSVENWIEELNHQADDSYKVLDQFSLEKLFNEHPDMFCEGSQEILFLKNNSQTLSGLVGTADPAEQHRGFACCRTEHSDLGSVGERVDLIWPNNYGKIREGTRYELLLLSLIPNLNGRRIEFIQSGMPQILKSPRSDTETVLSSVGDQLDLICDFHQIKELESKDTETRKTPKWERLLRGIARNLLKHPDLKLNDKTGCFSFREVRLGQSLCEILCRLAGLGINKKEANSLTSALNKKPSAPVDDDKYKTRLSKIDKLVAQISVVDVPLKRFWGKLRSDSDTDDFDKTTASVFN